MTRGIYIMANDSVIENAVALLNSIRCYDAEVPIMMVPYDNRCHKIEKLLADRYGVQLFCDRALLDRISDKVTTIFGPDVFVNPNQLRKQACWFGPFDEFLYLDTDIVVFEKIIDNLVHLGTHDFVCCDYQFRNGIKYVFLPSIVEERIFNEEDLRRVFNAGFWGSKKGLISEESLFKYFSECAEKLKYFDFSTQVSDMPVFNYLVLAHIRDSFNIAQSLPKPAGEWAGCKHFIHQGHDKLIDPNVNRPLKYLHWAGIKIQPGCPYYDIWKHYRDLVLRNKEK